MQKCSICDKSITKKSPGLECNKCAIPVHAKTECAGLTAKQLTALRAADNLEWTCNDCANSSTRRSSFVIPEDDEEEEDGEVKRVVTVDVKKFMDDLQVQIDKLLKKQLNETNRSVQYLSDKVDECLETMQVFKQKIKDLEKKNVKLVHKSVNLENRVNVLEQRMNEVDQKQICNTIEIVGVPFQQQENIQSITRNISVKINSEKNRCEASQILKARRVPPRAGKPDLLQVTLIDECTKSIWLQATKEAIITVKDLLSTITNHMDGRIYAREMLTPLNKNLLWKTKQELNGVYKYVWCKEGKVLARKNDNEKVLIVRCESDLSKLKQLKS